MLFFLLKTEAAEENERAVGSYNAEKFNRIQNIIKLSDITNGGIHTIEKKKEIKQSGFISLKIPILIRVVSLRKVFLRQPLHL